MTDIVGKASNPKIAERPSVAEADFTADGHDAKVLIYFDLHEAAYPAARRQSAISGLLDVDSGTLVARTGAF